MFAFISSKGHHEAQRQLQDTRLSRGVLPLEPRVRSLLPANRKSAHKISQPTGIGGLQEGIGYELPLQCSTLSDCTTGHHQLPVVVNKLCCTLHIQTTNDQPWRAMCPEESEPHPPSQAPTPAPTPIGRQTPSCFPCCAAVLAAAWHRHAAAQWQTNPAAHWQDTIPHTTVQALFEQQTL